MDQVLAALGWLVYGAVVLYAISGVVFISRAMRAGGSVTQMGLFQWGLAVTLAIAFPLTGWNKLHLLWVIPVGFVVSFTSLGRSIGNLVGAVTVILFGGDRSRMPPK